MNSLLKKLATFIAPVVIMVALYFIYLAKGGDVAREDVKAYIKNMRVSADYTLSLGAHGGDCEKIGDWDNEKFSCTLKNTLKDNVSIQIAADNLILDGNNMVMHGQGDKVAIYVINQRMITIKNLKIEGYQDGIYMQNAKSVTVSNIDAKNNEQYGINMSGGSNNNVIENNRIGPSVLHGIAVSSSHGNQFVGNTISNNRDGIRTMNSSGNVFIENIFSNNRIEGLDFHNSTGNRVIFNSFITDKEVSILSDISADKNFYNVSAGGNYYSAYDEPVEGCDDINGDGYCDKAFEFVGVNDKYPFVKKKDRR